MADVNQLQETINDMEFILRKMSVIIKQKGREILQNFPITPPQFVALQWLNEEGDMTIGDLSNKMYLAFSTTTDLIDRMESNQLLERIRDNKDRRVVQIHLLDKGKKIIDDVIEARRNYLSSILTDINDEQITAIHDSINSLFEAMKQDL